MSTGELGEGLLGWVNQAATAAAEAMRPRASRAGQVSFFCLSSFLFVFSS